MNTIQKHNIIDNTALDIHLNTALRVINELMSYRRTPRNISTCGDTACQKCLSQHYPNVINAVKANKAITLVLPAFPGKSPNLEKVLGPLPDLAEKLSLKFLGELCSKVKSYYSPGIKIILCSDGRVFSDIVGIKESDITAYQNELDKLIEEMSLRDISTFNLDNIYELSFSQMRDELMKQYGSSLEVLKHKVKNGAKPQASTEELEANRMYCGITRFLFEDSMHAAQTKSRSALQKDAKARAYQVIRRSNAWSDLIEEIFPYALRLSIHPQICGSRKLGIRLIGNESWMTPWHGVAVESTSGFSLLKRSEAQKLGAKLIKDDQGRASHYKLDKQLTIIGVEHEV